MFSIFAFTTAQIRGGGRYSHRFFLWTEKVRVYVHASIGVLANGFDQPVVGVKSNNKEKMLANKY